MTKTIAVLGAGGRLGQAVALAFADAGYKVRAVTRDGRSIGDGIETVAADAMNAQQLARAVEGVDFVFNGLNPIYTDWPKKCLPMARNVMAAIRGKGITHLFIGNVYPFGSPMPAILREDTPMRPSNVKGHIRQEMKALFRAEAEAHGTQTIILRAGDFFGSGVGSWFDQALVSKLDSGKFVSPGRLDLPHAWAYVPDLARAFVAAANAADKLAPYEVFHFPGHTTTLADMKASIERASGKTLKTSYLPWWVMRIGGLFKPMLREFAIMSYLWREPHQLVSDRIEARLGALPHTPLDQAVAQAMRDLK